MVGCHWRGELLSHILSQGCSAGTTKVVPFHCTAAERVEVWEVSQPLCWVYLVSDKVQLGGGIGRSCNCRSSGKSCLKLGVSIGVVTNEQELATRVFTSGQQVWTTLLKTGKAKKLDWFQNSKWLLWEDSGGGLSLQGGGFLT